MPNAPKTPQRALRIPDDEWTDLGQLADAGGTDRTAIVRELLQWYLRRPGAKLPTRPERP